MVITPARPAGVLVSPEEHDRLLERERFVESVHEGLADAEAGWVITDEEIGARLDHHFGPGMKLRWTHRAEQQLVEIGRFIARTSHTQRAAASRCFGAEEAASAKRLLAGQVVLELDQKDTLDVPSDTYLYELRRRLPLRGSGWSGASGRLPGGRPKAVKQLAA